MTIGTLQKVMAATAVVSEWIALYPVVERAISADGLAPQAPVTIVLHNL